MTLQALFIFVLSYLLGSIPFGLLLTKAAGLGDIRDIGSGNIGATNVLRTGNQKLAALTMLLDGAKGTAAVLIAAQIAPTFTSLAALSVMLGHMFPLWLKFKGGKGVATGIGVMTALAWPAGILMMLMWLAVAKRLHLSSLAALIAFGFAPLDVMIFNRTDLAPIALLLTCLIYFTHRDNIRRLLNHSEPKIGASKPTATPTNHT